MKLFDKCYRADVLEGVADIKPSTFDGTLKFWITPESTFLPVQRLHATTIKIPEVQKMYALDFDRDLNVDWNDDTKTRWIALEAGFIRGVVRRNGHLTLESLRNMRKEDGSLLTKKFERKGVTGTSQRISLAGYFNGVGFNLLQINDAGLPEVKKRTTVSVAFHLDDKIRVSRLRAFVMKE